MGSLGIFSPNSSLVDDDGETALAFPCGRLGGTRLTQQPFVIAHSVTHINARTPREIAHNKKVNNLFARAAEDCECFAADALGKLTR